ncbi:MAG: tail fiber domain-containing protein [Ferruginibacter sp.]
MKKLYLQLVMIFIFSCAYSQNVGIGTNTPEAKFHIKGSADTSQLVIDAHTVQSNTKPLIKLRDAAGNELMRIHTDAEFNVFMGYAAGRINNPNTISGTGLYNTFIGSNTGYYNTSGSFNTALGRSALYQNTTGVYNTGLGYKALFSNIYAQGNTAIGYEALLSNTFGHYNTAVGATALFANSTGSQNVAIGESTLYANTTAEKNVAIGAQALSAQSYSDNGSNWQSNNVAVGYGALTFNQPTSTLNGIQNTAIGNLALFGNSTGYSNTATGYSALYSNTIGYKNSAFGQGALYANSSGSFNTAQGYGALASNSNCSENTAIGFQALYTQSYNGLYATGNTAVGAYALHDNEPSNSNNGKFNTGMGQNVLSGNTTGLGNTAIGAGALEVNITGSGNTAIGFLSGPNIIGVSNTTCVGNGATSTADNQMVLGNANVTQFYCYGAYVGTTSNAANLTILNTGQILRSTSSRRYKKDIIPLDINTAAIYNLAPKSYNSYSDQDRHFGLVAEEVAEVIPELVTYAKEKDVVKGSSSEALIPDAVQYPLLSVLVLKEVQKHEQIIKEQQLLIEELKARLEKLEKKGEK